jgi:hypothetical protein
LRPDRDLRTGQKGGDPMPSLTTLIATGLGAVLVVPVLAFAGTGGNGSTCLPAAAASGATTASQVANGTATTTTDPGWDTAQTAIAATIVAVGRAKGVPAWGWVVAVATAMQESRLRNLPDGDADSIGVFQQRPSQGWGTPTQLASPIYQAGKFYDALLSVPNWQRLPADQAAQQVQRSAYPRAYGQWITPATLLVERVASVPTQAIPGAPPWCMNGCPGPSTDRGRPAGTIGCSGGDAVLARAATWLTAWNGGPVPYSMSSDPATLFHGYRRDCSGYASMALGLPGPGLNTSGLAARSTPIRKADLRPGDLLINPALGGAGHVVIFERWTSPDMDAYLAYEQSGDGGTHHRVLPFPYAGGYPMSPYRL